MNDYEISNYNHMHHPMSLILDQEENPMRNGSFNWSIKDESIILGQNETKKKEKKSKIDQKFML